LPPTASSAASAPRATVESAILAPSALSVVEASVFRLPRNFSGVGAENAGPLTRTKSCVTSPSLPGSRAPSTPITFTARPRGVDTLSSRMSPGSVESRITTG